MTVSILNECLLLRNKPLKEMVDYLHGINIHLFDDIIPKTTTDEEPDAIKSVEAKQAILYVLCAFSEESPMIIMRQDDKVEKDAICEFLNIPELYRPALLTLSQQAVRKTVTRYVTQFAGPLFKNLFFLKIQLADYELNVTNRNYGTFFKKDEEGNLQEPTYDFKEHAKSVTETIRLSKEIAKLENEIKGQIKRLDGIESMKEYKSKATNKSGGARSGNVENSNYIK